MTMEEIKAIASRAAETVLEDIELDAQIERGLCAYAERIGEFFDLFRKKKFAEGNAILKPLIEDTNCEVCQEIVESVLSVAHDAEAAAGVSDLAFRKNMAKLYEKVEWARSAFCPDDDVDTSGDEGEIAAEDTGPPPQS